MIIIKKRYAIKWIIIVHFLFIWDIRVTDSGHSPG